MSPTISAPEPAPRGKKHQRDHPIPSTTAPEPKSGEDKAIQKKPDNKPKHIPALIHLFSGPERPGSLQEHISALNWRSFPVDTVLQWTLQAGNDLSKDVVWEGVEYMVTTGQAQGVAMDPPCSTCSRARKHPPAWPRRIRSKSHPLGLPRSQLISSEIQELKRANYMYHKTISLARTCCTLNIPWYIEQPEPWGPEDDNATFFDFPETIALMALPGVKFVDFDQCEKGAETVKPTRLLYFGLDMNEFQANTIDGGPVRCTHPKKEWTLPNGTTHWGSHPPALTLSYKNKLEGKWNSKDLSEYPSEMNRQLAGAFHNTMATL